MTAISETAGEIVFTLEEIDAFEADGIWTPIEAAAWREKAPPPPIVLKGRPDLHSGQLEIRRDAVRFNVINCGRRFGKDILCIDTALDALLDGKRVGWYQPTYKSLMEVWRAMKKILAPITPKGGVNVLDKRIEIQTEGVIEFWSLDGDPEASRGRKYHRVIINEAAKARQLQTAWDMAIRPTLMDYRGDAWFPSTPRGRDYYYDLYQRGQPGSLTYDPNWKSWQKPTHDNPHIPREELEDAEKSMPTTVYHQEILAEFLDVAGRFFDEWMPSDWVTVVDEEGRITQEEQPWHVVDPFPIPAHWPVWAAVDPGTSKHAKTHCALLFASDPEGGVVIFDEIYESGKQSAEQAVLLLEKLEIYHKARPIDPSRRNSLWKVDVDQIPCDYANFFPPPATSGNVSERRGKWPVEYYQEMGLPCVRAVKDRVAGWRELKQWMHDMLPIKEDSKRLCFVTGEDFRPKLRVFRGRCSNLIRTIPMMIRDERNPEDIEEDALGVTQVESHLEQHPCDTARYGLMTRPGKAPVIPHDMTQEEKKAEKLKTYEETNRAVAEAALIARNKTQGLVPTYDRDGNIERNENGTIKWTLGKKR